MTGATMLAGAAGALGVAAAWDAISIAERGLVRRALAPLRRAGRDGEAPTAGERRRLVVLLLAALVAGGWLLMGVVPALLLATAAPGGARAIVSARRRRWRADLVAGAPLVARALADALSGGHSVRGALTEVARRGGLSGAADAELGRAARALEVGEPTEQALEALRLRAGAPAYDAIVAGILLQRDAGGDLAALLRQLAGALEEAARQARAARAITAQARFTGLLVAGLPLGAAALAELAQPGFLLGLLRFGPSAALLLAAAVLQVVGLVVVRRLARPAP